MPRTIAIGDIHGCSTALIRLIELVAPQPDDVLVPLGDFVDRGIDSKGVIEQLISLGDRCRLVPILGGSGLLEVPRHELLLRWLAHGVGCGQRPVVASG